MRLVSSDRVCFLTGAGISVASGLRPYRGPGGLWTEEDPTSWASAEVLAREPQRVWDHCREMARVALEAPPNRGHVAIQELERRLGPESVTVLTQNVDGLHGRAGSKRVAELHGSLERLRCSDARCSGRMESRQFASLPLAPPPCPRCGQQVRFDIVLFGEYLDFAVERAARDALRACTWFIAVGTSGSVAPAAGYAREAAYAGARCAVINLEAPNPPNPYFHEVHVGRSEEILPDLLRL